MTLGESWPVLETGHNFCLCEMMAKVAEPLHCNSDLILLECSWGGGKAASGWQNSLHKIGAIIAPVTVLDGFCIWMQLFASFVRNGGSIKDLPFVSDVLEWQVSQRQCWNEKWEGLNFSRDLNVTCGWFFQALLHRYPVCSLCSNCDTRQNHSDSSSEKSLWCVGFSAVVSLKSKPHAPIFTV